MKMHKVLMIFVGLVFVSFFGGVREVRADESCGYGSRCVADVYRSGWRVNGCHITSGRCYDNDLTTYTGYCYNGGPGNCGFSYASYSCNFNYPYSGSWCQPATATVNWYDCCRCESVTCDKTCGGGTDNCGGSCNTQSCCTQSAPNAPSLSTPTAGQVFTTNPTINFSWSAPASWGEGCSNSLSYQLCVSDSNGGACNRYDKAGIDSGTTSDSAFIPTYEGIHWWKVAAVNNGQVTWSGWQSFSAKVVPNCSNLTGPTEVRVGVSSNFSALFSSPMALVGAQIFYPGMKYDYNQRWWYMDQFVSMNMQTVTADPQTVTGSWIPIRSEGLGAKTVSCRAWNDGKAECRPPSLVDSWPRADCAGPGYSFNTCVEGFDASYITRWEPANSPACGNQTRTCTENCGTNDCTGVTLAQCTECAACAAPFCGQATNCSGACSNADNGNPSAPTCSNLGNVVGSPQTISWTNGGTLADTWFYSLNGGSSVSDSDLTASVAVNCGSNNWRALARNTTCGNDNSAWSNACTLCRQCVPSAPTCTSIAASTDSTPTISWSDGVVTADTWFYKIDGGAAVAAVGKTADVSPAVTCGSHNWQAMGRDNTCGNADSNWSGICTLCYQCSPDAPTLVGPANGTEVHVNTQIVLDWNDIASWGTGCPNTNSYYVCLDDNGVGCTNGYPGTGVTSQYSWTPTTADSMAYWAVIADNGPLESWSAETRNVCVEGFDGANVSYVSSWSNWSICGDNHTRSGTRTCTETCGVDDCNAFMASATNCPAGSTCTYNAVTKTQTKTEDCTGVISGVLFDGSDYSSCPGDLITNPSAYGDVLITNQGFLMTSPFSLPSWPPSDNGNPKTLTTNLNGFYSVTGFSPGVYTYDFSALEGEYTDVNNPKLKCTGFSTATLWGSDPSCMTMPCTPASTNNSFGFWRVYGGWWQVTGGSVYAKSGIKSYVPASVVPAGDQRLILPDANNRIGMLSYGVAWGGAELGTNPDVRVSDKLWRIQSLYDGLRYDHNFYNTRMDVFASTPWDGGAVNYTDVDNGYQIFKNTPSSGTLTLNYGGPMGTEKVILLVDGDVVINSNVVVPVGAFLGIIAKGNITFGSMVASAQGWFVAENISVPCKDTVAPLGTCDADDVQFVGEGSFVGWTGIDLKRDRDVINNTAPSEKFIYRPDMFINVPTPMKVYTKEFSPFIP